jgi:protein SCO1/2
MIARSAVVAVLLLGLSMTAPAQTGTPWNEQYFPDVQLTTQDGAKVRFYDLIKGKTVAIELIYTSCRFACPLETARLAQVQRLLGDRMGRDVFFYSISIDPEHDTPAVLKAFAETFHAGPGWTFLTGQRADIERLGRKLGLYSTPNPEDKDGHVPALLIGNESTGDWMRASALDNPNMTATMITRWIAGYPAASSRSSGSALKSYADARPVANLSSGQYLFSTKCSTCHGLGDGAKIGPDLAGVTTTRTRAWLASYIADPQAMLKRGDPIAKALSAKYGAVSMPTLQLTDQQVQDVIQYLDRAR